MEKKLGIFKSFFRYNVVAILATGLDFFVLVFLTEVMNLWYLASVSIGAVSGGILAFILERNWTFEKRDARIQHQALKYAFIWSLSISLNVAGVYLLVDKLEIQYILSKVIIAVLVGVGFNFFTHKYFIFK